MTKVCSNIERWVIYTWCPQLMKVPIIKIIKVAREADLQRTLTVKFSFRHVEFQMLVGQSHVYFQIIFFKRIATQDKVLW